MSFDSTVLIAAVASELSTNLTYSSEIIPELLPSLVVAVKTCINPYG